MPNVIRIGTCTCAGLSIPEGTTISVLESEEPYIVEQIAVPTPEMQRRETIRSRRCHAFVDFHNQTLEVALVKERTFRRSHRRRRAISLREMAFHRLKPAETPSAELILSSVQERIKRMKDRPRRAWLRRLN